MYMQLNPGSGVALYVQIMKQIRFAVASGALQAGDQLPSVRDLALRTRVNPNTVAKAYGELEHEGLLITKRGMGTFVAHDGPSIPLERARGIVGQEMEDVVVNAMHLGVPDPEMKDILDERIHTVKDKMAKRD